MKKILLYLVMMAAIAAHSQTINGPAEHDLPRTSGSSINSDWLSAAQTNIVAEEYYFRNRVTSSGKLFVATNRQQKTAFSINSFGYRVTPVQLSVNDMTDNWSEEITLLSINRKGKIASSGQPCEVVQNKSTIAFYHDGFSIEYLNGKDGLRQNFIITGKPGGTDNLQLSLHIDGSLLPKVKNNQLQFENGSGQAVLYYRDLNVWDANHKTLKASMSLTGQNELVINVDDRNAIYPVTIDPISQTSEWSGSASGILPTLVGQLAVEAAYGFSIAGVGDINGDGYDDVAIGAPGMADVISGSGTLAGVGAVFVYCGSATGLPVVPSAVLQPTTLTAGALFGYSIAGGDINNDGKSDIIVGAPLDNVTISTGGGSTASGSVGKVYAFNGATLMTSTTPLLALQLSGNGILQQVNISVKALFGFSVAVTEDVNNDGKKDIIVGAPAYAGIKSGFLGASLLDVQSGGAFVFVSNASDNNKTIIALNAPKTDILGIGLLQTNIGGLLFGYSVDGLGDYNGDGKPDVIASAPAGISLSSLGALLNGKLLQGSAMVYYGNGAGVSANAGATLTAVSGGLLTNLTGSVSNVANLFGTSVKGVRNASGVRNGNVLVGAPLGGAITNVLGLELKAGTVSIFKKKVSSPSGYVSPDQVLSSPRNSNDIFSLIQANLLFGYSMDNTLDLNCDGIADIIIGEPASSGAKLLDANVAGGAAYVYLGKADGTYETAPAWTVSANTDAFLGVNAASLIGYSVAGAGHVKGVTATPRILTGSPSKTLDFGSGLLNLGNTFGTLFNLVAGDNGIGKADLFDTKFCELVTLPVSFTQLKAKYTDGISHITWGTITENNSADFEIERSTDGIHFIKIGKVAAAGTSNKELKYQFDDSKVSSGNNYYRLKMIDANGSYQYSNIALVNVSVKGFRITNVYPSPFADRINVDVMSENDGEVNIKITSTTGKSMMNKTYNINNGTATITITSLEGFSKGLYIMQVKCGDQMTTRKILKQ
jgi:hypothetical protein